MPINFSGSSTFSGPAFAAYGGIATTIPSGSLTQIKFGNIYFDTINNFSTVNNRFTPTVPGYYQINSSAQLAISATNANTSSIFALYRNGNPAQRGARIPNSTSGIGVTLSTIVSANGTTDYFEIRLFQDSGNQIITESSSADVCPQFSASYIRSL